MSRQKTVEIAARALHALSQYSDIFERAVVPPPRVIFMDIFMCRYDVRGYFQQELIRLLCHRQVNLSFLHIYG